MKVLVATDGSDTAVEAAHRAIELLREDAHPILVTVIPEREDPMDTAGGFEGPAVTEEEAAEDFAEATEAGRSALERTADAVGHGAEVLLVPVDEEPGHAIVDVAERIRPDLIVVGSGGKGFFKRLLTGSVSDFVVRHAPCPVLVVPHEDHHHTAGHASEQG